MGSASFSCPVESVIAAQFDDMKAIFKKEDEGTVVKKLTVVII